MSENTTGAQGGEKCHVECGNYLNIAGVSRLHDTFFETINNNSEITIDITDPERIDTAGIQLLCALVNEARTREVGLTWSEAIPDQLRTIASLLGMEKHLELPQQATQ